MALISFSSTQLFGPKWLLLIKELNEKKAERERERKGYKFRKYNISPIYLSSAISPVNSNINKI